MSDAPRDNDVPPPPDFIDSLKEVGEAGRAAYGSARDTGRAMRALVSADFALARSAFGRALAWACARAVGLGEPAESRSSVATTTRPHRRAVTPAALAAVSLVTVCGVAVAGRPTGRFQALDLIAALPDARLETTWPTLHSGVSPQPVLFGDRAHRGLVAMRFEFGMSFVEIAGELGETPDGVRVKLNRVLKKMIVTLDAPHHP